MERRSTTSRDTESRERGGRDDRGSRDEGRGRSESRDDRGSRDSRDSRDSGRGGSRDSGRGGSGFSYQRRSAEDARKRASESTREFDSFLADHIKTFKPSDGYNTIRILPPTWDDPKHYGIDLYVHYGVGPDEQAYLCLHKMKGEACPICEERDRARRAGESEEYVKDLDYTRRTLFYLVDRNHEKDGVVAWAAPFSKIDQAIVKVSIDRQTGEALPIDDPDEGYDIEFDKGGKGIGTQYTGVAIARRDSPLGNRDWLDFAVKNPLPSILEYHSYDHIQKVFGGGGAHTTRSSRDSRDTPRDEQRGRDDRSQDRTSRDSRDTPREEPRGPKYTWDSIHSMTGAELDDLVEQEKLDINPNKAESDAQLADWICEDLKITQEEARRPSREASHDDPRDRLRSMREGRRD